MDVRRTRRQTTSLRVGIAALAGLGCTSAVTGVPVRPDASSADAQAAAPNRWTLDAPATAPARHGALEVHQAGLEDSPFAGPGYVLRDSWTSRVLPPPGVLVEPVDIRWAPDGTFLVTDRAIHRVQRFSAEGVPLEEYGRPGDDPGELYEPRSATASPDGSRVYVADAGNSRVAIFNRDGSFVSNWVVDPAPTYVAPSKSGVVYVTDLRARYITVYDPKGKPLDELTFRVSPSRVVADVAYDPNGRLRLLLAPYVLTETGDPSRPLQADQRSWDVVDLSGGPFEDQIHRLTGGRAMQVSGGSTLPGAPFGPEVLSIDTALGGNVWAVVSRVGLERAGVVRLGITRPARQPDRVGDPLTILGWIGRPLRLGYGAGSLHTADERLRVQRFSDAGVALGQTLIPGLEESESLPGGDLVTARRVGGADDSLGGYDRPPSGFVRHLVERLTFGGPLSTRDNEPAAPQTVWHAYWDEPATGSADRTNIAAVALDAGSRVNVLDAGHERLLQFALEGTPLGEIDLPDQPPGAPGYTDMTSDVAGRRLLVHTAQRKLIFYDRDGAIERTWDTPPGTLRVAAAPAGGVVLTTASGWFWALDASGRFMSAWRPPAPPQGADQTAVAITDIAVGDDGTVFAADYDAPAIHAFEPGVGAATLPAPGPLACRATVAATAPARAQQLAPFRVTLAIQPACPELRAGGRLPDHGLRDTVVRLTLDDAVTVSAASLSPAGSLNGRHITWNLDTVPRDGLTLALTVAVDRPGPIDIIAAGRVDALDGWFNFGVLDVEGPEVRIETTRGLLLPRLPN